MVHDCVRIVNGFCTAHSSFYIFFSWERRQKMANRIAGITVDTNGSTTGLGKEGGFIPIGILCL